MSGRRVAVGAIFTECNHFGGEPIDLSWFERYELRRGEEVLQARGGVLGGMLAALRERRMEVVPLLFASTCPGGPLTASCYRALKEELLARLEAALPVDGVLLPLHGAAAVEGVGDLEGDLIGAVRARTGEGVRVVATLDLHAHVSAAMVAGADALVAWETYPHADAFSTGERGARLLCAALEGRCRPAMAMAKVPVISSGIRGSTEGDDPFAQIMRFAKASEGRDGVLSTSVFLVHPYLDLSGMGSGGLVVADGDRGKAEHLARAIARKYWERRRDFEVPMYAPQAAVAEGLKVAGGPVLLVEAADCCGGGAAGDGVAALRALLQGARGETGVVPVVDAEVASACHRAGEGAQVRLALGHRHDPRWGEPVEVEGRVGRLADGGFVYEGGIWDGVEGHMGPSAVLQIDGLQVLVASHPTYEWAGEQFQALGLEPEKARFLVVKNPMNYRMAYGQVARAVFVLDTPGPTPATVRHLPYRNVERPFFPLDEDMEDVEPVLLRSQR